MSQCSRPNLTILCVMLARGSVSCPTALVLLWGIGKECHPFDHLIFKKNSPTESIKLNRRASKRAGEDFSNMYGGTAVLAHIVKLPRGYLLKDKPLFFDGPTRLRNDAECAGCILLYFLSILSGRLKSSCLHPNCRNQNDFYLMRAVSRRWNWITNPKGIRGKFGACNSSALTCLLYTSPSPRDQRGSRMPSSA